MIGFHTLPWSVRAAYLRPMRSDVLRAIGSSFTLAVAHFYATKELQAGGVQLYAMELAPFAGMLLLPFMPKIFRGPKKLRSLLVALTAAHVPSFFLGWVKNPDGFAALVCFAQFFNAMTLPAASGIMQANWPAHLRGRIYSAIFVRVMIVSIFGKYAAGELLAWDPGVYCWMTPFGGMLCLLSLLELRALKVRGERRAGRSAAAPVGHFSLAEGREILRQDKPFLWYERVFALGALINQIGGPLYVLFLANVVRLSWGEYKFLLVLEPLIGWLSVPFWGKMFDRQGSPFQQRALLNVFWGAWPLGYALAALGLGRMTPLCAAEAAKGVADKGSAVNWTLGAVNFAPPGRAAAYNAVHLVYCGLRGFLGVCIGLALYKFFFRDDRTLDSPVFFQIVFFILCLTAWLSSIWLSLLHRRWGARFRRPESET